MEGIPNRGVLHSRLTPSLNLKPMVLSQRSTTQPCPSSMWPPAQRPTHQADKGTRLFLLFPPSCPTSANLDNHLERRVQAVPRLPIVTDDSCTPFANEDGCWALIIKHQCAVEYFDIEPFMNNSSRLWLKLITLSYIYCRGRCCSLFLVEVGREWRWCTILRVTTQSHGCVICGVVSKRRRRARAGHVFGRHRIGYSFWSSGQRQVHREITLRWEVHRLQRGWRTPMIGRRELGIYVQLSSKEWEKWAG